MFAPQKREDMTTIIDVMVDGPALGVLPQRLSLDLLQIHGVSSVLPVILASLVDADGAPVSIQSGTFLTVLNEHGSFVPLDSLFTQLVSLARLRITVPSPSQYQKAGGADEREKRENSSPREDRAEEKVDAEALRDAEEKRDAAEANAQEEARIAAEERALEADVEELLHDVAPRSETPHEHGEEDPRLYDDDTRSPPPTPQVVRQPDPQISCPVDFLAPRSDTPPPPPVVVDPPTRVEQLTVDETTTIMLDVVKLVVADLSASSREGADAVDINNRKLDVYTSTIQQERLLEGTLVTEIADRFRDALLAGYQLGIASSRGEAQGETTIQRAIAERDALQRRLDEALRHAEELNEALLESRSRTAAAAIATDESTNNVTIASDEVKTPTRPEVIADLPAAPRPVVVSHHLDVQVVDTQAPTAGVVTASDVAPPSSTSDDAASGEVALQDLDAVLDFTMVSCFYNAFDYLSKTTRKLGRALSLRATKSESRYDMLRGAVDATFHPGLHIGYLTTDGVRHEIDNDTSLSSLLLQLKKQGIRPVFQCYSLDEETVKDERVQIGSSPKRLFVRSPAPPVPPAGLLQPYRPASSRPTSASTYRSDRPISAMSVQSSTSTSLPFDYIAGSALDEDALAAEFETVANGCDHVSKDDVLAYLEARYDTIGEPNRFRKLLDQLFRRKSMLNINEFAIVLLRLSQS